MKVKGDEVIFSTGKRLSANFGIIGLSEPDVSGGWGVSEGADGLFCEKEDLTKREVRELADYMIGLWERFKKG